MKYDLPCIPVKLTVNMNAQGRTRFEYTLNNGKIDRICDFELYFNAFSLDGRYNEELVLLIIKHEFAHYFANFMYNDDCNHDERYEEICKRIGIPCITGISVCGVGEFLISCPKCGQHSVKRVLLNPQKQEVTLKEYSEHCRCSVCHIPFNIHKAKKMIVLYK
jgi:predicted SprT family Zn-dependent metalloprotease